MTARRTPWLLAALAVSFWLAALLLARAVLAQPPSAVVSWDVQIATDLHNFVHGQQWVVWVAKVFAVMGSGFVLVPLTIAVVVVLARSGFPWWAAWVGACGMGGWMISQGVKNAVDRQRPVWPDPFEVLTSPSFPSGHSMAGVYGYVVFGIVALALLPRRWPGVALITFGMLMGPSRVLLGVHWPSDVLMGWLLGGAWICTTGALVLWVRGSDEAVTNLPGQNG
jgi:undecaprenyl-diphosphatase